MNCKRLRYIFVFIFIIALSLPWTAPLGLVNVGIPDSVRLLKTSGNIYRGSWQDMEIDGKRYPLTCDYQRQKLSFSGVNYILNCDTPVKMNLQFKVLFNGDVTLNDGKITGDLSEAYPWFFLIGVPVKLSGPFDISISKANIQAQTLTHLDISGYAQQISLMDTQILRSFRIETQNAKLSDGVPIVILGYTEKKQRVPDDKSIELNFTNAIDGKNYYTQGEISGHRLLDYATLLRFFAHQVDDKRFAFALEGKML